MNGFLQSIPANMHLGNLNVLLLAAFAVLVLNFLAGLLLLRKERNRRFVLEARGELLDGELKEAQRTSERLRTERDLLQEENRSMIGQLASLKTTLAEKNSRLAEREEQLESTRLEMEKNFQLLAEKIFSERGTAITRKHQDELSRLLQPLREQLGEFRKKVEYIHDQDSRDRVSLIKEIEHLKSLNQQIGKDAVNLTNALKGQAKVQGLWGEMVLERLLENSGLKKGEEFEVQVALQDKNGGTRLPDVLVRLPREREIIIDAKVSLKAYEQVCRTDDPELEKAYLQRHTESVRRHIRSLADKEYHLLEGINSLEFTVLFIPAEGAFQTAVCHEPELLTLAMEQKIILASPSTLMAILRTIHHLWRQEEQTRNSLAIAKQAGSLYDKFIGFLESFEEVGARLDQSKSAWELARNRLTTGKGNLVSRTEGLKKLGVQSRKSLPGSIHPENDI